MGTLKMNNYHTHTQRCRHAVGDERAMVEAAIAFGSQEIGFSDHVPLPDFRKHLREAFPLAHDSLHHFLSWSKAYFNNGPGIRMPYQEMEAYLHSLDHLKKEYAGTITIYKGFECEYFEAYLPFYRSLLQTHQVDYLIFGHHYHEYAIASRYYGKKTLTQEEVQHYFQTAIQALDSGLFSYFAHPDLFFCGYHEQSEWLAAQICKMLESAKKTQVVLEINASGFHKQKVPINGEMVYPYPNRFFWQLVKKYDCPVMIGLDAHSPTDFNHDIYQQAIAFCSDIGLTPKANLTVLSIDRN